MHVGGLDLLIVKASQHRQLQSQATMPVSTDVPDKRRFDAPLAAASSPIAKVSAVT